MKSRKYLRILILVVMVALAVVLAGLAKGADQMLRVEDHPGVPVQNGFNGSVIATAGDWLAVSMPATSGREGRVLLWKREGGLWRPRQVLPNPYPGDGISTGFGLRMAMDGGRLLVSSSLTHNPVHTYVLTKDTWVPDGSLEKQGGDPDYASFGSVFAVSGNLAVVGAPSGVVDGINSTGWVDVYERLPEGWKHQARLSDAKPWTSNFGSCLDIANSTIVVGLPDQEWGTSSAGRVSVFTRSGTSWRKRTDLSLPVDSVGLNSVVSAKVSDGRLMVMCTSYVRSIVYDYAATPPYALRDKIELGLYSQVTDFKAGTFVCRSDPGNVEIYRRPVNKNWVLEEAFDRARHQFAHLDTAHLTESELLLLGMNQAGRYVIRSIPQKKVHFVPSGQISSRQTNEDVTRLHAGEYGVGTEVSPLVTLSAFHEAGSPASVDVHAEGDLADFSLSSTRIVLEPGKVEGLRIVFKPSTEGQKYLRLTLTSSLSGEPPIRYEISAFVTTEATAPRLVDPLGAGLYGISSFQGLRAVVSGTRPWAFRWFKDGKVIPGETEARLMPTEGGTYQVEVTNPWGTLLSNPEPLGLYREYPAGVVTLAGSKVRLPVSFSGPDIKVRWEDQNGVLQDGPSISGVHTSILTIRNVRPEQYFAARLSMMVQGELWTGEIYTPLHVLSPAQLSMELESTTWIVDEESWGQVYLDYSSALINQPVFHFRGLPPGMQGDAGGQIHGFPTRAGNYKIQVSVMVDGLTVSRNYAVSVIATTQLPGIYWGWLQPTDDLPSAGAVMLDLQNSGAYSAVIYTGSTRTSIAGTLSRDDDIHPSIRRFPVKLDGKPQVCWAQSAGFEPKIAFLVRDAATPNQIGTVVSELLLIRPSNRKGTVGSAGHYTFGLMNRSFNGLHMLEGNGFGTLNVDTDGRATYAGQLADGSSVTGSTWLSDESMDGGQAEYLYFYQADTKTGAVLRGAAPLKVPDTEEPPFIEWQRPAKRGRLYAQGIDPRPVAFIASRYAAPKNTPLLPRTAHWIRFEAPGNYVGPVPFKLTRQHKAVFGTGEANPNKVRLDMHAPTGFFTGQFTVRDLDPQNPSRTLIRTAPYRGILLQDREEGVGYFLLPSLPDPDAEPPTTLKTSPIISGSVLVESLDDL